MIKKVLGPSTCSASFSDKEHVRPQQQEPEISASATGCVSGIPHIFVIIVIEKPRTQGDSTQSKVLSESLQAPCRGATVHQISVVK